MPGVLNETQGPSVLAPGPEKVAEDLGGPSLLLLLLLGPRGLGSL